jgi:CRISPR-associated protein Csd2
MFFGSKFPEPERYNVYVKEGPVLNKAHEEAYKAIGVPPTKTPKGDKGKEEQEQARQWMCARFADIRLFGGVLATEINCGGVHGPIQFGMSRSFDVIYPQEALLTRCAATNEKDEKKGRTFGRKTWIPYGLYRVYGSYSTHRGQDSGVTEQDLRLFWEAMVELFEHDRSAARGMMAPRRLLVFSHPNERGIIHAHKIFERLNVNRVGDADVPRKYSDYEVTYNAIGLPPELAITELL